MTVKADDIKTKYYNTKPEKRESKTGLIITIAVAVIFVAFVIWAIWWVNTE